MWAIGVVAQGIGEWRFANRHSPGMLAVVTQQVRGLEERYRDMALSVNDKLVVVEFKAPRLMQRLLVYDNIDVG